MRAPVIHRVAIATGLLLILVCPLAARAESILFGGVTHSDSLPPANTRYPVKRLSTEISATEKHKEISANEKLSKEMPATEKRKQLSAEEKVSREMPATEKRKELSAEAKVSREPPVAKKQTTLAQSVGTLESPMVEWIQVPKWMAGTWNKKGDQTISLTDLRTGVTRAVNEWTEDDATATWGCQYDREGNIWHANFLPLERDAVSSGRTVKFVIVSLKPELRTADQLVGRVHSIVTESVGSQIINEYQQESLNDYILLPSGQLQNRSSNRDFTYAGQPTKEGELVSLFTRVRPFVPEATHNGIDLLKSLNEYLVAHNMSQLVRTAQ